MQSISFAYMTSKQENKLSMYLAVKAVCDRNNTTWQTLQAFVDGYADFGARVTNIQNLAQNQAVDSPGISADKDQLRKTMAIANNARIIVDSGGGKAKPKPTTPTP